MAEARTLTKKDIYRLLGKVKALNELFESNKKTYKIGIDIPSRCAALYKNDKVISDMRKKNLDLDIDTEFYKRLYNGSR